MLEFLGDEKGKAKLQDWRFWLDGVQITVNNWVDLLELKQTTEMLSISMKLETPVVPEIKVSEAGEAAEVTPVNDTAAVTASIDIPERPDIGFVILPVLAWPLHDNYEKTYKHDLPSRVDSILSQIYLFLFAADEASSQQSPIRFSLTETQQIASHERVPREVKTSEQVREYSSGRSQKILSVYERFRDVYSLFISLDHGGGSPSIGLYWGAVFEIIVRESDSSL